MLNFGASKPRVRGGPGPRPPPDPRLKFLIWRTYALLHFPSAQIVLFYLWASVWIYDQRNVTSDSLLQ